ncbi:hypothetical protein GCM10008956_12780 [Deinococcus arenae]|uniref:Membrane protein 6-pyruvoyl-tetrahydropterin synthase-related domain-containing protein n=1 Tax=Deinococcus arenae TaxID=1452751 RepID=A0A8H9L6S9_9DEIO|nr:hypothetical protein [Deinococcus arenae]AWT37676.1 hypothetical protein DM785_18465 [Deinococcus actinosclerus]GGM37865.1 hypothetical protein GCM10008956_12780 [Deinococcus arenae]
MNASPPGRVQPRLLLLALLLTGAYHGVLALTRAGLNADQASSLLFLASAYARAPLDPFDPRWYGGVPLTGHAPLVPQLMALLSGPLGLEGAYAAAQFLAALSVLFGMYRFTRLLGGDARGAGVAGLLTVLGTALTLSLSVFGELGAVLGAGLALNGAPALLAWVRRGRRRDLPGWLLPLLAAAAAHSAAPLLLLLSLALTPPLPRAARRRALLAALGVPLAVGALALPDRLWTGEVTRVTAPALRAGRSVWLTWALPLWSLAWAAPSLLRAARHFGARSRGTPAARWLAAPASVRAALLALPLLLGALLSLVAPVPWQTPPETLTVLGALLLTPFAAQTALRAWDAGWARGRASLALLASATLVILSGVSLNALPRTRALAGPALNLTPLLNFIEKDEHWRYRFLTVGFGRQLGTFSAQTRAATPSGLWHVPPDLPQPFAPPGAAAQLPERLPLPGQGDLQALLTHPERVFLKFVYARSDVLDPLLYLHGWHSIGTLENGVNVWEREDIPPVPARLDRPALPVPLGALWGTLPLLALLGALLAVALPPPPRAGEPALAPEALPPETLPPDVLPPEALRPQDVTRVPLGLAGAALALLLVQPLRPAWTAQRFVAAQSAQVSARGGLRGPYARLNDVRVRVQFAPQPAVTLREDWWTPLGPRRTTRTLPLRLGLRGWQVVAPPPAPAPAAQPTLSPQADVTFYRAPRRITTNVTAPADVLDRPALRVLPGRLTRDAQGTLWYLGEVLCADARPADLTVTVILRLNGERVAEENLGLFGQHLLRSGERSPLRVPLRLSPALDRAARRGALSAEVNARAVVSGRHLERPLVSRSRVRGGQVQVVARNASGRAVATPLALLTLYDARGVSWVHAAVGPELLPGASWTFTLPATPPPGARDTLAVPAPAPTDVGAAPARAAAPGAFPRPGGTYRVTFVTLPAPERP